ncbi:alanine/glycine:cation symporter family protein [Acinetobacter haemolyticus]|uniref:Alanine:cation symporter family protein n=2 Tax=Acinetobacter haemolyticus TaxID=29430 RepID=A0AAW4J4F7_ACIHA|nr:alanine/glycine:cation symporter family protein [Acinetobacter haemolyticus]EFF81881.1 amino acid carrier protein [Acinetobacter haemolyticus ATCC 19194]MBO3657234.1 alanine:cation symporter family protein [Acinetobacter haemolyticus]MCU4377114.1 alanine:cation symporter family protein [Acinetobacter haemolyticus]NAS09235.1 amino acid carrier protein [Acinetobacter haemolyticus]WHR57276.1 alanine/glycine:cation symporter family protein [Acinetobacter haemolyticus]
MSAAEIVDWLNGIIWSPALIYLCLGAGLFFSILTRFVQIRQLKEMGRLLIKGTSSSQGISSFQALSVSLSGRVGVGNIAGVAAAIGFGGPGAVFWMWVVAFLGASTAYVESTLGQIYKVEYQGQYRGGPAFYFDKGLGQRWLGILFAIAAIISCGLFLPGIQANAVGNAFTQITGQGAIVFGNVGVYKLVALVVIVTLLSIIIFGGIKRIARFAQFVVPFMALGYIIMALVIVFINIQELPNVIRMIFADAFTPMAGVGAAIGWGVKRGVYSNEAGQGTGPHAAAAAEVQHPAQQGLVQSFSVYIDTLFVCSATAFMILITGMYNVQGTLEAGQFIVQNVGATVEIGSPAFTQMAVSTVFGGFGQIFVALAVFFFAFTTIIAYYYIAETNITYLSYITKTPSLMFLTKCFIIAAVVYGVISATGYIWGIGDIGVGLMAWINIIGIILTYFIWKPTIKALRDYEKQQKAGVTEFTFDPVKLGIRNATFWEDRLKNKSKKD